MNTLEMDERFEPRDPSRRFKGIAIVVLLHALIGYALVSGLPRKVQNFTNKPLEAVVIQEVIIPPPPPPIPKRVETPRQMPRAMAPPPYVPTPEVMPQITSNAPVVASVATPTPEPAVIGPQPTAPSPVAAAPKRTSIGLACPIQVPPEMPRKALRDGIEGVVTAQIHVKGGRIVDVTILSGPAVFHAAVKAAMMKYTCVTDGDEVVATQVFNFKVE